VDHHAEKSNRPLSWLLRCGLYRSPPMLFFEIWVGGLTLFSWSKLRTLFNIV
jgi:hypothetical protein